MFVPEEAPAVAPVEGQETPETPETGEAELSKDDLYRHSTFLKKPPAAKADNPDEEPAKPAITPEDGNPLEGEASKEQAPAEEGQEAVKFKLADDEEVTLDEIREWQKGNMLQSDYTKKTQALAEDRRQFEAERGKYDNERVDSALTLLQNIELDPIGALDKLREHFENQGIYDAKDEETLKLEMEKRQIAEEKRQLEAEKKQRLQEEADQKLENQLTKLAETYGKEFDREKTIQFMKDNEIFDAEKAFKAMAHDTVIADYEKKLKEKDEQLKTAKTTGVNEYVKEKTTKKPAPLPVGASATGSPPVQINPPKTFADARKAAMARDYTGTGK